MILSIGWKDYDKKEKSMVSLHVLIKKQGRDICVWREGILATPYFKDVEHYQASVLFLESRGLEKLHTNLHLLP